MSIESLEESHSSLFSLPDLRIATGAVFLIASIFSLLEIVTGRVATLSSFAFTLSSFLLLIFPFPLSATCFLNNKKTALTLRRSLWGSLISTTMSGILFLFSLLVPNLISLFFFLAGIGLKFFWDFLLTYSFSVIRIWKGILLTILGPLLYSSQIFLSHATLFPQEIGYELILFTFGIFLLAGWGVTLFADFIGKLRTPIGGKELFRGFALAWLKGEREVLEKTLEKISVKRELPVHIVLFKGKKPKGIWIIPTIHPGPLLNVGSSDMTIRLSSAIRSKYESPVMIFHGTCTHSENLPSLAEQKKFIEKVVKHVEETEVTNWISPPVSVKNEDVNILSQLFGSHALLSVSLSPLPMDDITLEVGRFGKFLAKNESLGGTIIDTHNSIGLERKKGKRVQLNDELAEDILDGIKKTLKKLKQIPPTQKVKEVNFGTGKSSTNLTQREGLGPEGIKVSLLQIKGSKYAYVGLDANNLESGLREEVLKMLEHTFMIEEGEVYTSDTHVMNATGSEGGYPLINRKVKDKLLNGVKKATKKALEDMEPVKVYNLEFNANVKVQGEKSASALTDFAEHAVRIFYTSLLICLIPAFLGVLLLSFFPFL